MFPVPRMVMFIWDSPVSFVGRTSGTDECHMIYFRPDDNPRDWQNIAAEMERIRGTVKNDSWKPGGR